MRTLRQEALNTFLNGLPQRFSLPGWSELRKIKKNTLEWSGRHVFDSKLLILLATVGLKYRAGFEPQVARGAAFLRI